MKTRYASVIIAIALCFSANLFSQTATVPANGDGTEANPYQITSLENLYWIAADALNWDKHYIQIANINAAGTYTWFNGAGWVSIGNNSTKFTGKYNGQNFTIDSLRINRTASYRGLFGYIQNATIENLNLTNVNILGGQYTGGFVGYSTNSNIERVNVTGNVSSSSSYIGGFAGFVSNGLLHYVSENCNVTGGDYTGGLVGYLEGGAGLRHSYSKGSVIGAKRTGGLVGYTYSTNTFITDCYSHSTVTGTTYVGGLIGNRYYGSIFRSYSTGAVTGNSNVGGLIGAVTYGSASYCYWDTESSGRTTSAGGTGRSTEQMKTVANYPLFNFDYLWQIEGDNYPEFKNLNDYDFKPSLVDLSTLEGEGTEENPYIITDAYEFNSIRSNLTAHYKLGNDIDLSASIVWNYGAGFTPIGWSTVDSLKFKGTLDGDGNKIIGLHNIRPLNSYIGLFGYAQSATIRNFDLENAYIQGNQYVGSVAGYSNNSNIEIINITGKVFSTNNYVGGLIGYVNNGSIHYTSANCFVHGESYTGGLVGYLEGGAGLRHSYSKGSVIGAKRTGGLVGYTYSTNTFITDCYSHSTVTGTTYVGGLIGNRYYGSIFRSYSTGAVTGNSNVGGLIGAVTYGSASYCYWDTESSGRTTSAGGTGRSTGQMKTVANYPLFNFNYLWKIEGDNYPEFKNLNDYDFKPTLVDLSTLDGEGTEENPYIITDAYEFNSIRSNLTAHYKLGNDIDLSISIVWNYGAGFTPIGWSTVDSLKFKGTLDGDGYKIIGLHNIRPLNSYFGLFGYAQNALIRNFDLENAYIQGNQYVGSVAGYSNNSNIEIINITGKVFSTNNYVGGLIGYVNNGSIHYTSANCFVDGESYTGGLVGYLEGGAGLRHSYSKGSVIGAVRTGGLVGYTYSSNTFITDCYSHSTVTGTTYVGGLIGYRYYGSIFRSYSAGAVTGNSNVGGLIGGVTYGSASYCYWDTETSGRATSAGGSAVMGRTTEQMTYPYDENTYVTFDMDSVWKADEFSNMNNGYPYLAWQDSLVLDPPLLVSPQNNSIRIELNPNLVWQKTENATSYSLQVSTDPDFSLMIYNVSEIKDTTYQIEGLEFLTDYYWRVRSHFGLQRSQWSEVWSFTTEEQGVLVSPVLLEPVNNSIDIALNPSLEWQVVENASSYTLQVSTTMDFSSTVVNVVGITNTEYQLPVLAFSTQYFWRVSASDGNSTSYWSEVWSFTTEGQEQYPAPVLLLPENGATDLALACRFFEWGEVENAIGYSLQLSSSNTFLPTFWQKNLSSETTELDWCLDLQSSTEYYWRARTNFPNGISSPWSDLMSFTTLIVPEWTLSYLVYDFGSVDVDSVAEVGFKIINSGAIPISINTLTFNDTHFSFNEITLPYQLEIGDTLSLIVSFSPEAAGFLSSKLTIEATDISQNATFKGTGKAPAIPPTLSYSTSSQFNGSAGVFPTNGSAGQYYQFRVVYTDIANLAPLSGFPKVMIDFDGDGEFTGPNENGILMAEVDGNDLDFTDGKEYVVYYQINNIANMHYKFIARNSYGNDAIGEATEVKSGPNIITGAVDLKIFASDIVFSNYNPFPNDEITIYATIHNGSDYAANNVNVRIYEEDTLIQEFEIPQVLPNSSQRISMNHRFTREDFYPIKVYIDEDNEIEEINELNNFAIRPIIVGNFSVPGEIEATAYISPNSLCNSGWINFYGHVNYVGGFDPNSNVTGAEVKMTIAETGQEIIGHTDVNGNYSIYFKSPGYGTYHVSAYITDYTLSTNTVSRSFTVNNCVSLPELWTNITISSGCKYLNDEVYADVAFGNSGDVDADNVLVIIYSDGELIYDEIFETLAVGQMESISVLLNTSSIGRHSIEAKIDPYNEIEDNNWYNNNSNFSCFVYPYQPDLVVRQIVVMPFNPTEGVLSRINVELYNRFCYSSTVTTANIYDEFNGNSTLIHTQEIPALQGFNYYPFNFNYIFTGAGVHTVRIEIVPPFNEWDVTNNEGILNVNVRAALADITVSKIIPSDHNPAVGDSIILTTRVANIGFADASTFFVKLYLNNILMSDPIEVSSLNYGDTIPIQMNWTVTDCPREFKVIADETNLVEEYDEHNVCYTPARNFKTVVDWNWPTDRTQISALVNTTVNLNSYIVNDGIFNAENLPVTYRIEGDVIAIDTLPVVPHDAIGPNTVVPSHAQYVFTEPGRYSVIITPNDDGTGEWVYCESSYTDNNGIISVRVYELLPDLEIWSEEISPDELNPDPNEPINIYASFRNIGHAPSGPFHVKFFVDSEQLGDSIRVDTLNAFSDWSVQATSQWSSPDIGLHVIRVELDALNEVVEVSKLNNEASRAVIVGDAPDFAFSDGETHLQLSNYNPNYGDLIEVSSVIANRGGASGTGEIRYYLIIENDTVLIHTGEIEIPDRDSISYDFQWIATSRYGKILAKISGVEPIEFNLFNNTTELEYGFTPAPLTIAPTANPSTIWLGQTSQLSANASGGLWDYTYRWESVPEGFVSFEPDVEVSPEQNTTYLLYVSDGQSEVEGSVDVNVEIVSLVSPANNSENIPLTCDLIWNSIVNAIEYSVQVSTEQSFTTTLVNESGIEETEFQLNDLEYSTTYFWRVSASDGNSTSYWSEVWSFTTEQPALVINLFKGWNTVSSFFTPFNPNLLNIFNEIMDKVDIIKNGEGQISIPALGINQIGNWNVLEGYQINVTGNCYFFITGEAVTPENTTLQLSSGWHLVSYLRRNPMPAQNALQSITESLVFAKDGKGHVYHHGFGINTIGNMLPGQGYWVYVNEAAELIYPSNSAQKTFAELSLTPLAKQLIPIYKNTGNNATLLLQLDEIENGAEVGVYNVNDELIGSGAVHNGVAAVTIWGDDEITKQVDGAVHSELLSVKLLNSISSLNNLSLYNIKEITGNTELDNLTYQINAIYLAKATVQTNDELAFSISCVPNPVANSTTFEFSLADDSNAEIVVYSLRGDEIAKLRLDGYSAGMHRVVFNTDDLANGSYNVVLRSGTNYTSTIMMIVK